MKFKVKSWRWLNCHFGEWVYSSPMTEKEAWRYAEFLRGSHEQITIEEVKGEKNEQATDIQTNTT